MSDAPLSFDAPAADAPPGAPRPDRLPVPPPLTPREGVAALAALVFWLVLFAGGIMIDTTPYRCQISPEGVRALDTRRDDPCALDTTQSGTAQSMAAAEVDTLAARRAQSAAGARPAQDAPSLWLAWLVVMLWFLPVNLAWLCATAGVMGAFGNIANLSHDQAPRRTWDYTNPYVSAVLRGFFVYLFLISGLLLLDDAPFSSSTPAQYVRLAGFLSLLSFAISYSPNVFGGLIEWAFYRIRARTSEQRRPPADPATPPDDPPTSPADQATPPATNGQAADDDDGAASGDGATDPVRKPDAT
jgi:hypothetical protein